MDAEAVTLTTDPTQDRQDRFGRLLAYVDNGGQDAGEAQIRAGYSDVYIFNNRPFLRLNAYRAARHEAEAAERGVWRACNGVFHAPARDDVSVAEARQASAERFVRPYYSLLNRHRYSSAWGLLSRSVRRQLGPFASWRAGFRRTIGTRVNEVSVSFAGGRAILRVAIRSRNRDACTGRSVRQYFRGRWVLVRRNGYWAASSLRIRRSAVGSRGCRSLSARRRGGRAGPAGRPEVVAAAEAAGPAATRAIRPASRTTATTTAASSMAPTGSMPRTSTA